MPILYHILTLVQVKKQWPNSQEQLIIVIFSLMKKTWWCVPSWCITQMNIMLEMPWIQQQEILISVKMEVGSFNINALTNNFSVLLLHSHLQLLNHSYFMFIVQSKIKIAQVLPNSLIICKYKMLLYSTKLKKHSINQKLI